MAKWKLRVVALCAAAALCAALCILVSMQSQSPKLDSRLTVDHVSIKTMLEWKSHSEPAAHGCSRVNIEETGSAYLCEVQGLSGKNKDRGEYEEAALRAIEEASVRNVPLSMTIDGPKVSSKEGEGRACAEVACVIDDLCYRGYIGSHVNRQGAAVCLCVCPEEDFAESAETLKAVASSVKYAN